MRQDLHLIRVVGRDFKPKQSKWIMLLLMHCQIGKREKVWDGWVVVTFERSLCLVCLNSLCDFGDVPMLSGDFSF